MRRASRSEFVSFNGVRHHVRLWGPSAGEPLFLLHGWMDVSASFQFLADALPDDRRLIAPDWRGFGRSDWPGRAYSFPDYLVDLDALLQAYAPQGPVEIVGHSLGGVIACLYAGVRPDRVDRLATIEGIAWK